jgi:23S rRNA (pseudouridine1915-N3)-methyltransferase
MSLQLITVSQKQPEWVTAGYEEYAKRLAKEWQLTLNVIPTPKRSQHSIAQCLKLEAEQILATIRPYSLIIALDERGEQWSSEILAKSLQQWLSSGESISFIIGGPDGLSSECKEKAHRVWSLSPLTLPHGLVRVMVAEQLYRAWSIGAGHPYHRT